MVDAEKAGRTVVFVSHNMSAILSICPKAIWIDRGTISSFGETRAVIGKYLAEGSVDVNEWSPLETQGAVFRYHKVAIYSDQMG